MYPVVTAPGVADSNVCAVGLVVFGPTFTVIVVGPTAVILKFAL